VLSDTDVIYWTRVQEERFARRADYEAICDNFIMTPQLLNQARRDVILMHPLPRKNEMGTPADHDILDANPRSVYFQEMENGMFIRMALLAMVLGVKGL
jgi:aspartate carbamoyltransferase catalytic subunit